jgi:hypothetical protein
MKVKLAAGGVSPSSSNRTMSIPRPGCCRSKPCPALHPAPSPSLCTVERTPTKIFWTQTQRFSGCCSRSRQGAECQGARPRAVVRKATQRLMKWLSASRGGLGGEAVSAVVETDRLVLAPLMMMVTITEPDGRYRRLRWCNRSCCSLCSWRRRKALS